MKLISYEQNEHFKKIRLMFINVRMLHDCMINYDTKPEEIITSLAARTDIEYNNFASIKNGLIGVNTKDKTITLGFKYLSELFIKTLDDIIEEYKHVVHDDQTLILKDNIKSVLGDVMLKSVLEGNIDGITSSLPAKEFAANTFIILLEKALGKGADGLQWLGCLKQTLLDEVYAEVEPIPFNDNRLASYINTKLTHIDNNKGNTIYVTEKSVMERSNLEVMDTSLSDEIRSYVSVTTVPAESISNDLVKAVFEVCELLFNIDDKLTARVEQLPEIDYILVFNVLTLIRNTIVEYGEGKLTKDIYSKLMVEYVNVYVDLANGYINVNDKCISECIKINRNIKLAFLSKTMFENMLIEGSISYKG